MTGRKAAILDGQHNRLDDSNVTARLADETRLECRICWYVYDPALGDDVEQIAPDTPFATLPDWWHCPQCDAGKDKFLPIDD